MTRVLAFAATAGLLALGCGESRTGGGGGGLAAWDRYCETTGPERAEMCGTGWGDTETPDCMAFARCVQPFIRADLFGEIPECLESRECGMGDDSCFSPEYLGSTSSDAAMQYFEDCHARRTECEGEGTGFTDDYCYVGIANDATVAEVSDCLELACGEITDCLRTAIPDCG